MAAGSFSFLLPPPETNGRQLLSGVLMERLILLCLRTEDDVVKHSWRLGGWSRRGSMAPCRAGSGASAHAVGTLSAQVL